MHQTLQDQEILTDMLTSEKQVSSHYNTFAGECSDRNLKNDMLNILRDGQAIQDTVFCEMHKRGWYPVPPAQQQMVEQARTKFEGSRSSFAKSDTITQQSPPGDWRGLYSPQIKSAKPLPVVQTVSG